MKQMMEKVLLVFAFVLAPAVCGQSQTKTEREWHNLRGPVHTARVEVVRSNCETGECTEGPRRKTTNDTYDRNGDVLSSTSSCFDPDDPAQRLLRYPFGDQPAMIEKANFETDGTLTSIYQFFYDNINRQAEWVTLWANGMMESKTIYLYDTNGRRTECTTYDSEMELDSRTTYAYDGKGNEVERVGYGKNNVVESVISYEYEFDEFGNWVKQLMTIKKPRNGQLYIEFKMVSYRTITYYYERLP